MSLYFARVQIHVRVVEYDLHTLIVDCCTEYIINVRNTVVSDFGQFGPSNLDGIWRK